MVSRALMEQVSELSALEQSELVEFIQRSWDEAASVPFSERMRLLVDERLADMRDNPDDWVSAADVVAALRDRHL